MGKDIQAFWKGNLQNQKEQSKKTNTQGFQGKYTEEPRTKMIGLNKCNGQMKRHAKQEPIIEIATKKIKKRCQPMVKSGESKTKRE